MVFRTLADCASTDPGDGSQSPEQVLAAALGLWGADLDW